jgi:2-polyprenyl-3-methyl-5-hydroxy-6-metoxy-1,4-benzoquinol methylase
MEFTRIADIKRVKFITNVVVAACSPGAQVLDIGCGNGIISRAIGEMGFNVLGIDVSEKTIEVAKAANTLPNVQFKIVAAGELESEPGVYDAIICSEVLEHLHQPEELLHIIHSSLKDNGILIVTVPNGRGPRELFVTRPIQALQRNNGFAWRLMSRVKSAMGYKGITVQSAADDLTHIQFFTVRSLKDLAAKTGFRIEQLSPTNFIEQVFPFSLIMKRSRTLQKLDCRLSDALPINLTSGFMSVWRNVPPLRG